MKIKLEKEIRLPAVKKVTLELIPPFDIIFFRDALKTKNKDYDFVTHLNWPEAEKAMYRNVINAENQILHLKSCCDKALNESIIPLKDYLWNKILCHSGSKEI